jgi:catechol 2,3-dioxygenase-like lactoylglutathione lyase family enzyme
MDTTMNAPTGATASTPAGTPNNALRSTQVTVMLPVKDLARARRYYEQLLQLEPLGARPDGKFVYRCGGTEVALFPKPEGTKAEHTALSFRVDDIAAAIAELKSRGVEFDDYDLPGFRTVEHVCVLGSEKAAWFRDPEGNILCLHEDLA